MRRIKKCTVHFPPGSGHKQGDVWDFGGTLMVVEKVVPGHDTVRRDFAPDRVTIKPYRRSIFHVIYGFVLRLFRGIIKYFRDKINL